MKKHSYIRAALSVAIVGVSALVANIAQAAAPEPSAYWDGFYNLGELTVDPSCTIANGVITIGENGGISATYPTKNPFTVIADVSDCPSSEVTIFSGLFNNPNADADIRLVSNGDVLKHVWTDQTADYGSISDWDRERHTVAMAYQSGETTYIDGAPKFSGNASSSSYQVKNIYIGMRCKANGTVSQVATGMKVYRLAIFEKKLTDAEVAEAVAEYFPQEYSPQEGDIISFNFAQANDGLATETQLTLNGEIPVEAWSQKAAVNSKIESSVIYRPSTKETIPSSASMQYSASGALNYVYQTDPALDGAHKYMYYALARLNDQDDTQNITIADIPFAKYDLYLYFSGHKNVDGGTFRSFTANGVQYTVNASGVPVSGTAAWGTRNLAEPVLGSNAVRFTNLTDTDFVLSGSVKGAGVCAVQIVNKSSGKLTLVLDGDKTWSELLAGQEEPGEDTAVEVKVTGDWTLTLDRSITCARVSFVGEKVSITSSSKPLITDSIAKFNVAKLTDSISYIYNVASGYDAPEDLRNIIKGATKKQRFAFRGAGESGVKLDYGTATQEVTLETHIVFDGGKHVMTWHNSEGYGQRKFGANATVENPTIRVTGGAYLTFNAHNPCGWESGQSNANGIIRVDDGSTMEIIPTGGTCYWAQQIYLEPGATLAINDNGTNFRVNGGTGSGAISQFYVPDSEKDATDKPAIIKQLGTGSLNVNGQGTANMAVYVGNNSKLYLDCNVGPEGGGNQVTKYGAGILEASNGKLTDIPTWQLSGGTLVYDGELVTAKLNGATLAGKEMVVISDTLHVAGGNSTVKNVMFFGTTFGFGTSNTKLFADNFVYSPVGDVTSEGNGVVVVKDLTIGDEAGLPTYVGLDVNDDDGILRLVATEWETPRKLCGGGLNAPSGKVKRTIYLGDKAYKTKVLFDTSAKTIEVFKPGLLFFVQ